MKNYTVISPFKDLDGIHKPGDPDMPISDKDAAELIELGAVQETISTQSFIPSDPIERLAAITAAIGQIDAADLDMWLKDGRPDAMAISAILGWTITAAERNTAWAALSV